jgi:hypothetical protein
VGVGPDRVEQLVLRHELASPFDQDAQHIESLGVQSHRTRVVFEAAIGVIEAKAVEA